jgi:hypothetical protein
MGYGVRTESAAINIIEELTGAAITKIKIFKDYFL